MLEECLGCFGIWFEAYLGDVDIFLRHVLEVFSHA
jgi:hypothetical protein